MPTLGARLPSELWGLMGRAGLARATTERFVFFSLNLRVLDLLVFFYFHAFKIVVFTQCLSSVKIVEYSCLVGHEFSFPKKHPNTLH